MFDERLPLYTLRELHDAVDVVLLCSFQNNVRQEVHGTIFSIPEVRRFASFAIREVALGEMGEGREGVSGWV